MSIFTKNSNLNIDNFTLKYDDIKKSIPSKALSERNINLEKTHIEYRWRFFNINGRKLIEISRKIPNEERLYTNNANEWIKEYVDSKLDIYVCEEYYYYVIYNGNNEKK